MQVEIVSYEEWSRQSRQTYNTGLDSFVVKAAAGAKVRVVPGLERHGRSIVLGHDWLPISEDGTTTLEGMVHTPALYLEKIKNLVGTGYSRTLRVRQTHTLDADAILVGGVRNYYHWLINHLPRLLLVKQLRLLSNAAVLVNDRLAPYQLQSLTLLGIPEDLLFALPDEDAVSCQTLLVPRFLADTTVTHPAVQDLLRNAFPAGIQRDRHRERRIYISRSGASSRHLINEPEMVEVISRYGFESHSLETLTFQQQIDLFSGASAILGVHGAGLTNMVFAPRGARVIEIFTPLHKVSSMKLLSMVCRLSHDFVPAAIDKDLNGANPLLCDWSVDLQLLARELDKLDRH